MFNEMSVRTLPCSRRRRVEMNTIVATITDARNAPNPHAPPSKMPATSPEMTIATTITYDTISENLAAAAIIGYPLAPSGCSGTRPCCRLVSLFGEDISEASFVPTGATVGLDFGVVAKAVLAGRRAGPKWIATDATQPTTSSAPTFVNPGLEFRSSTSTICPTERVARTGLVAAGCSRSAVLL